MKKYLIALVLLGLILASALTTNAYSISELQAVITRLRAQIQQLKRQQPTDKTPVIISAVFDGNGVIIRGKNLKEATVKYDYPGGSCSERVDLGCVLQKSVLSNSTIRFISNYIGQPGTYSIFVESPGDSPISSNTVHFTIKTNYQKWTTYSGQDFTTIIPPDFNARETGDVNCSNVYFGKKGYKPGTVEPSINIMSCDDSAAGGIWAPPEGTDVERRVTSRWQKTWDQVGSPVAISGLKTFHAVNLKSSQSYGFDEYYVIIRQKLFKIQVMDTVSPEIQAGVLRNLKFL